MRNLKVGYEIHLCKIGGSFILTMRNLKIVNQFSTIYAISFYINYEEFKVAVAGLTSIGGLGFILTMRNLKTNRLLFL